MKKMFTLCLLITVISFSDVFAQNFKADSIRINSQCKLISEITTNLEPGLLYERTIKWINEYYQNPDKVLTGNIKNQNITVSAANSYVLGADKKEQGYALNLFYHIYFTFQDSMIAYRFTIDQLMIEGLSKPYLCQSFFNKNGVPEKSTAFLIDFIEPVINNLLFTYAEKVANSKMTSEEALSKLKKAKEKLDLQLISQEEYDRLKTELLPFII